MKFLFIAEKPSLMRDVQACYRKHTDEIRSKVGEIDFIALSGHVCTIFSPDDYQQWADLKWHQVDYPMIPEKWGIKAIDDEGKIKTLKKIKSIIRNYDGVIVGTDSDVEGYGIYYLLEHYLHIEDMLALRFMEHSLTDKELLKSLLEMTDYHNDPVHVRFTQSFLLRSRADWLYGMNGTRMMTNVMQRIMTVGRVVAATIKLVYDNSVAIEEFKPRDYYLLAADYGTFKAVLIDDKNKNMQFQQKEDIPNVSLEGVVTTKQSKRTYTHAPKLYSLADLQYEAGQMFDYSPIETLNIVQSLYEKHKVISYPRTQCNYVSYEKSKEFVSMLQLMDIFDDLKPIVEEISQEDIERVMSDKKVVNDDEVAKESHDALLPTSNRPILSDMTEDEINICHLIYARLLCQFLPQLTEDKTQIIIDHDGYKFITRGKMVVDQGWRRLYKQVKDNVISNLEEGDYIKAIQFLPTAQATKPPKRLTRHSLVDAMEHISNYIKDPELRKSLAESKGIGTSSTRGTIIENIQKRGYVKNTKKGLYITDFGKTYIRALTDIDITSPIFAAQLDYDIKKVQRGEESYDDAYQRMLDNLIKMCEDIEKKETVSNQLEQLCPICGEHFIDTRYYYKCPHCQFQIQKFVCGVSITFNMLDILLSGESTDIFTFKKKDKTTFPAKLILLKQNEGTPEETYQLTFDMSSGIECPECGGTNVKINKGGACCDCGLKVYRRMAEHEFTDKELKTLLEKGRVNGIDDFVSKKGDTFSANVILSDGKVKFDFD